MSAPRASTLRKSRNRFFARQRMPRDQNFWLAYLIRHAPEAGIPLEDIEVLRAWTPVRSNCPELEGILEELLEDMPVEWRPVAQDIFVGRTMAGDVQATADTSHDARIVTLTLQFTTVLHAYTVAFDEQQIAMRAVLTEIRARGDAARDDIERIDSERFARYWTLIETSRSDWLDPRLIAGLAVDLRVLPDHERSPARERVVLAAERWIVCHELAHHLLGHTVGRQRLRPVQALVDAYRPDALAVGLNPSQRRELDADVLAFLLAARACKGSSSDVRDLYAAEIGAAMALVAVAHVQDAWVTVGAAGETHPGFDVRWGAVQALTEVLSYGVARGPAADHPRDLMLDLSVFAAAAASAADGRREGRPAGRLRLLGLVNASLAGKQALWKVIGPPL